MPRRDRKRKSARREPHLEPKPIILIVCEGSNTEPQYFNGLASLVHNPRVRIETVPGVGAPKTIVAEAKRRKLEAEQQARREEDEFLKYDAVWSVFDRDDFPDIPDALQMAHANDIRVAFSNPCFELWLLLHFKEQPGMQQRGDIVTLLCNEVSGFDTRKKRIDITHFQQGCDDAIRRADRLCSRADDAPLWDRNPYTDVHRLARQILERSPEQP